MSLIELTSTARTYRELQAEIKELESQADALKQQMIRHMDSLQADELRAGEFTIRYKLIESFRLDTTALKNELPDVVAQYTRSTTSTRFQVA